MNDIKPDTESLDSFKRLCPTYVPEELRQRFTAFWQGISCHYESWGWVWDFGSGFFQCELTVWDLDSGLRDPAGYLAIRPLSEQEPHRIYCYLYDDGKFYAEAEVVSSQIFGSMAEAKAFLDSVLAFPTSKIPAPR